MLAESDKKNTAPNTEEPAVFEDALQAIDLSALEAEHPESEPESETPFPVGALGQWQPLAEQCAMLSGMPNQLPAMTLLGTISAAMGKAYEATGGSNLGNNRGNLFIIGCAKSSTGKDVAARLADPFFEYERGLQANHAQSESAEEPKPILSIGNATSEALAARMQTESETLFSFSPEAGDMMRVASGLYKNGKGEFSFYNGAWSGTHTQFTRMTREDVTLSSPCLSLCWSVQPDYFSELSKSPEAMHSGFLPRCLAFDAATTYTLDDGTYHEIDRQLSALWRVLIRGVLDKRFATDPNKPEQIPCTPEAREIFRLFHNAQQQRREREADLAALLGKARENAIRVALCLAVINERTEIGERGARAACAVVNWCIESTVSMLAESRHEALAACRA